MSRGWLRRLLRYCLRHRSELVWAFVGAFGASIVTATIPLITKHVVDQLVEKPALSVLPGVVLLLVASALRFLTSYLRRYEAGKLALDVQLDLRNDVMAALTRLDGTRRREMHTGQVVSRAISDVTVIQSVMMFLPFMIGNFLMFFLALFAMLSLSPLLTLIALAIIPAIWIVASRSRKHLYPANWSAQQEVGVVTGVVEAAISGVRVVKGFGQEQRELDRLAEHSRTLYGSRLRTIRMTTKYGSTLRAVPAIGQVAALAFGGLLALNGAVTLGTFLAFSSYLIQLVSPVQGLATLLTIGQQARASVDRVLDIVDSEPVVTEHPNAVDLPAGPLAIELDGVRFAYPDNTATRTDSEVAVIEKNAAEKSAPRPVLRAATLSVRPGETLALVGPAGSGKSTVSLLLPRFFDVQAGAVKVGGIDVRELKLSSLRSAMGLVFEDSFLFSDTVRANIAYGRPDATDEEVGAAAAVARADEFITALPDGYDTVVGEQGLTLSGGQRQRIALARAVLSDPRILILDDATSAIDATVENAIHERLATVMAGRTTLLIAHRRSTLALADRIAVLGEGADAGRIIDVGTEAELDARCPLFRALLSGTDEPTRNLKEATPAVSAVALTKPVAGVSAKAGGVGRLARNVGMDDQLDPLLLEQLENLPPITDEPDVDEQDARQSDPKFTLGRLLWPMRWPLALSVLLVAASAAVSLGVPVLVRLGVDYGVMRGASIALLTCSAVALVLVLIGWGVDAIGMFVTGRLGERVLYTLRVKTFAHLQRMGLDYYERELSGRILTRMTTDIDALAMFLQSGLAQALISVFSLVGVLGAMAMLNLELAGVLAAFLPVLAIATVFFRRGTVPAYRQARERISAVNGALAENMAGLQVSQAYNREDRDLRRFRDLGWAYRDVRVRAQLYVAIYFPSIEFFSGAATALILLTGAGMMHGGTLTAGVLIAFLLYVDLFFSPIQQLSQIFDNYQQASVALRRLSELLRTPTSTPQADSPLPVAKLRGELELVDVRFAYPGAETEALRSINLRIAPGETVALVGETGAGKSTVTKLLARFYDATGGSVRVDGTDIRDFDLSAYRQRLGLVPQEPYLFGETVGAAIAYGRPAATDEQVAAAARAVGADRMINALPSGYDHPIGERGRNLSAGQRQLLALARAELVEPDLLLLDEATAALDLASEAMVNRATEAVTRRRTTVVVAHRLTTAARADRIVVLAAGEVVEQGRHVDLVDAGGPYARLWEAFVGAERESA